MCRKPFLFALCSLSASYIRRKDRTALCIKVVFRGYSVSSCSLMSYYTRKFSTLMYNKTSTLVMALLSSHPPPFVKISLTFKPWSFQPPSSPFNKSKPHQPFELHPTPLNTILNLQLHIVGFSRHSAPNTFQPQSSLFLAEVLPNPIQTYHSEFHSYSSQYHHCRLKLWMTSTVKLHPSFFY
jgi:hypothetical protein